MFPIAESLMSLRKANLAATKERTLAEMGMRSNARQASNPSPFPRVWVKSLQDMPDTISPGDIVVIGPQMNVYRIERR